VVRTVQDADRESGTGGSAAPGSTNLSSSCLRLVDAASGWHASDAGGAASVASFLAAVLTEIYLCNVCSCQEILRRNGRG
jgi:hypothetical protein